MLSDDQVPEKVAMQASVELKPMYETMLLIRLIEERLVSKASQGLIDGFVHTYIGQEAVAAGVCAALRESDYITSTHRSHGHVLAKGARPDRFLAEVFGKADGYCGGMGGETHVAVPEIGVISVTAIVGGGIPIATGVGLGISRANEDRVVACFFGDGATNTGAFHEALNLASIWNLPVLFICENNGYAEFSPATDQTRLENLSERAAAYGIPGETIGGNDVGFAAVIVACAVRPNCSSASSTTTGRGHFEGDPSEYQPESELSAWRQRDPIEIAAGQMIDSGEVDRESLDTIAQRVARTVGDAFDFAEAAEPPPLEAALEGVYTDRREEGW